MTGVNVPLDDEENEIVECCQFKYSQTKPEAVRKLIRIAGETEQIKTLLKKREKQNKTK
ncbi:hypothetical protein ES703_36938 [subsurface metagenome]